jgi:cytochrome P450
MERYNAIMDAIASPLYALFPTLETLWPRTDVYELIASFHNIFDTVISEARAGKAGPSSHGMLSLMLSHDQLSEAEIRDNLIVFFLAGHDSTAATLSSVMYYLSVHPELQARARDEAIASFGNCDPMDVADFEDMPYGLACIREALRLNPPFLSGVPRICEADCRLGDYAVPAHTSFISNVYAMHHSSLEWEDPFTFRPERYLENGKEKKMPDEWCMCSLLVLARYN